MSKESSNTDTAFDPASSRASLKAWLPSLPSVSLEKLLLFQGELIKFNGSGLLVPPQSVKSAESIHIADSALAAELIFPVLISDAPLYDLGSGGGLPGVVFGVLNGNLRVTLVEREEKKVEFLNHVIGVLKLANVSVLSHEIESLPEASIQNAVCRSLATLPKAIMMARRPIAVGGRFFHMKSDTWANELASVPPQLLTVWNPSLLGQYVLPQSKQAMSIVQTDKIAK